MSGSVDGEIRIIEGLVINIDKYQSPTPIGVVLGENEDGTVRVATRGIATVRAGGVVSANALAYGTPIIRRELEKVKTKSKDSSKVRKPTRKEWREIIDA